MIKIDIFTLADLFREVFPNYQLAFKVFIFTSIVLSVSVLVGYYMEKDFSMENVALPKVAIKIFWGSLLVMFFMIAIMQP